MLQSEKNFKRIVVKVGSSFLKAHARGVDESVIDSLVESISAITGDNKEVVLVTSGAIAVGMEVLQFHARPKVLSQLQAAASVGQHCLMSDYSRSFRKHKLECGQLLLTWEDFDERKRYLNAKNTLSTLLKLGVIPVINENDTVSTAEIKFGDNDRLSALVATMLSVDLLVILSDVDGLLDQDKQVIPLVERITPAIRALACPTDKRFCVGGMITKIEAARIATESGIACVIANGKAKGILQKIIENPVGCGTLFLPQKSLDARKRWIAFGSKPKGSIIVDQGAKSALLNKKSLLSVGVAAVQGDFGVRSIVSIADKDGVAFARGRTSVSSRQLEKIKGMRSEKEVIHCDDIVIMEAVLRQGGEK